MFEKRKSLPSFSSIPSSFKKLEWRLAEELNKLEEKQSERRDEEFVEKLLALVQEYAVDHATIVAAARIPARGLSN